MEIISIYFVLLSIIAFFVFYLLKQKYRVAFLTLLSCGFIASLNLNFLFYILIYSSVNYFIGLIIPLTRYKKALFRTGIFINLIQIIILKYADFTINPIINMFNLSLNITRLNEFIVPLGISFFTLQGIGYLVNIKMGWEKPEKKFLNFLLYVIFYPKFLSGPVERSNHFLPQLKNFQPFNGENVALGLKIALWGFFKKVVIANNLATAVNHVYSNIDSIGGSYVWIIVFIQPLYLYFDFSGYTDIAIGLAKTYGIDLLPNFNRPFLSENVTTFWKRFHMSLSFWFNDYVFKQISFKYRKLGKYASVLAVFITFTLFGIWHGAGWNFMILGIIQAFAINYEFFTKRKRITLFSKLPDYIRIWTGRIITYCFFGASLIFFFSPDQSTTYTFFSKLIYQGSFSNDIFPLAPLLFGLFFALLILIYEILQNDREGAYNILKNYWANHKFLRIILYYAVCILIMSQLSGGSSFVYQMF
jgi:alginate O-acetyltransferase complex protein AlgI